MTLNFSLWNWEQYKQPFVKNSCREDRGGEENNYKRDESTYISSLFYPPNAVEDWDGIKAGMPENRSQWEYLAKNIINNSVIVLIAIEK